MKSNLNWSNIALTVLHLIALGVAIVRNEYVVAAWIVSSLIWMVRSEIFHGENRLLKYTITILLKRVAMHEDITKLAEGEK